MNASTGGGLGDVTSKNVLLQTDVSAQITATADGAGGYWVMSHSSGIGSAPNNLFYSFHVTASGITAAPPSAGLPHVTGYNVVLGGPYPAGWRATGQMKFSQNGMQVASAVPSKYVEVCNFNKTTGQVSGCFSINSDLGGPHAPFDASTVYGIEFAPLGRYLYISTYGERLPSPGAYCQLVQVDLQNLSNKNVVATAPVRGVTDFGELQLAPDGAIYMARQGRNYLSSVSNPDAATPVFAVIGRPLSGASAWGLPNMVQGPFSCGCPPNTTTTTVNGFVFCCSTSNGSAIDASTTNICCTKQ
jgi:hypothetical protein